MKRIAFLVLVVLVAGASVAVAQTAGVGFARAATVAAASAGPEAGAVVAVHLQRVIGESIYVVETVGGTVVYVDAATGRVRHSETVEETTRGRMGRGSRWGGLLEAADSTIDFAALERAARAESSRSDLIALRVQQTPVGTVVQARFADSESTMIVVLDAATAEVVDTFDGDSHGPMGMFGGSMDDRGGSRGRGPGRR